MARVSRCSFCGQTGHNRVNCEHRKVKVKAIRLRKENNEFVSYNDDYLLREDGKYNARKLNPKPRKCSYCYNRLGQIHTDHNRRNCPNMAADKELFMKNNSEWREKALKVMIERGVGVGAIINMRTYRDEHAEPYVVTDVLWSNISHTIDKWWDAQSYCFVMSSMSKMSSGEVRPHYASFIQSDLYDSWSAIKLSQNVMVAASERSILANVPEGWLEGKTDLDIFFDRKMDNRVDRRPFEE